MAKKYQKAAAARARANRHKPKPSTATGSPPAKIIREPPPTETSIDGFGNLGTDFIDVDDCGHGEGIINREGSEAEYQPGTSHDESKSDSGAESRDEHSSDKLEQNLQQQRRADIVTLKKPTPNPYSQIMDPRTTRQWLKAEKKRALGYNGQSERNKRRKNKDDRNQEELRKQALTSTDPQISMMRTFFAPKIVPPQPRQQSAEPTLAL